MSETIPEEYPIEERLRDAIDQYREVADEDEDYDYNERIIIHTIKEYLEELVEEAEEMEPEDESELAYLILEANVLLGNVEVVEQHAGRNRRRKGKSKKSKSKSKKARKTRRRLL